MRVREFRNRNSQLPRIAQGECVGTKPLVRSGCPCQSGFGTNLGPMTSPAQILHVRPGEGAAFSAVGDVYRILATGEQSGGLYALTEARVLPGGGPPPHIHHCEDESFFVMEGEITFTVNGRTTVAGPGSFVQGPRGIPHAFQNAGSVPARMLILVTPPGFENFLAEMAHPVPSFDSPPLPVTPADIEKLLRVAPKYGIEILPPPGH